MSKTRENRIQTDTGVVAAVHRTGKVWRVVVARLGGPTLQFVDSREFNTSEASRVESWLQQHKVGRVIGMLPASAVICRTCTLPDASPTQLEMALRLQAESHLLGTTPPHRQAMAMLPAAPGERSRSGLILAWPESYVPELPPMDQSITYAPETTALAALLNGSRPADPLMWLDRANGTIAFALTHDDGAVFRATREDPKDFDPWRRNVGRAVVETAMSVGRSERDIELLLETVNIDTATVMDGDASLVMPREVAEGARARVAGAPTDDEWWTSYGMSVGVLLAANDQLAPLTQLVLTPPTERPSIVRRVTETLRRPQSAAAAVVIAILLMMFAPLVLSAMRLKILEWKMPDFEAQMDEIEATRERLVMYRALDEQAWSMTKLLGDLANVTPAGVELVRVQMSHGDDLSIDGTATPRNGRTPGEIIADMQKRMNESRVYSDAIYALNTSPDGGYSGQMQFHMSAKVAAPHLQPDYADDYAKTSLREILYGPDPNARDDATTIPVGNQGTVTPDPIIGGDPGDDDPDRLAGDPGDPGDTGDTGGGGTRIPIRPRIDDDNGKSRGTDNSAGTAGSAGEVPPPLTQEQVDVMNEAQARDAYAKVARARQLGRNLDEATSDRLKNDFNMLRLHIQKFSK